MFSVVIPLYNKAHTIERTLQSVLNQTYTSFEVIIVDDGSTDNGIQVINEYTNDSRIRIFSQENQGVSVARNNGANESQFDYLTFLDGDDEWISDYLENVIEVICQYPDAKMIGFAGFFKNEKTGTVSPNVIEKYLDQTVIVNYFINPDCFSHLGATVVKKSVFKEVGGFPNGIRVSEDVCFLLKVGLMGEFVYCGKLLHIYVGNVDGQTTALRKNKKIENRKDEAFVYNNVYERWKIINSKNKLVPIFLKYKLRHFFYTFLKSKDCISIETLCQELSRDLRNLLGGVFISKISKKKYRRFFVVYILLTKLIWRLNRFPRVGEAKLFNNELVNRYTST